MATVNLILEARLSYWMKPSIWLVVILVKLRFISVRRAFGIVRWLAVKSMRTSVRMKAA